MVRTRLPMRISEYRKINGSPASANSSPDLVDRFANLNLKKKNMKNNNGRIPLSPAIEIKRKRELAAKIMAEELAKKVANHSKGSRPAIPFSLYKLVQDAVEVMNRSGHREDDLKLPEARIRIHSYCFRNLLPVGWKYERENAISLIDGYKTDFEMDGLTFIM